MNNSGAPSAVRVIRLDAFEPRPAVASGARLAGELEPEWPSQPSVSWPDPIGSARARAPEPPRAKVSPIRPQAVPGEMPRLPHGVVTSWPVRFEASAGDYARLWLSNLVRIILTGGLYLPWARVRSQRFFMRHTRVADHRLDYHEPGWHLLPRYGLGLCLLLGVAGAWAGSTMAGMLALSLAMAVWPLLVFMSLNQQVAHISWAHRRLSFDGLCQDVYRAMWAPLAGGCALAWLLMAAVIWHRPGGWLAWGVVMALWLLAMPSFVWTWFRFRQHQLRVGPVKLVWKAAPSAVQMLFLRTLVWTMLTTVMSLGVAAVALALVLMAQGRLSLTSKAAVGMGALALVCMAVRPYAQARLQNLVWSQTGNRYLRVRSKLSVSALVAQQCRHAGLLLITLGLYWPWAVVATRRLRTDALMVWSRVDADILKANWPTHAASQAVKMTGSPGQPPGRHVFRLSSFGHST
jgi:uncharacterized membrane protein YjgN (DUF898 family)